MRWARKRSGGRGPGGIRALTPETPGGARATATGGGEQARRSGRIADALLFSSLWLSGAAALLTAAAARALGAPAGLAAPGLAFGGTLAIYSLDRLRDVEHDRASAPARTAFVERHRAALAGLGAAGALLGAGCAARLGLAALLPLALALPLAVGHRRLKHLWFAKAPYVTAGWLLVVVGVPAAAARAGGSAAPTLGRVAWVAAVLGLAIFGNAVASNVRDAEAAAALFGGERALRVARAAAAAGVALALVAPPSVRPLACVALATLAALAAFRPSERYGLGVLDGALALGALGALALG